MIRKRTKVFIQTLPMKEIITDKTYRFLASFSEGSLTESTIGIVIVVLQPRDIGPDDALIMFVDETRFAHVDVVFKAE